MRVYILKSYKNRMYIPEPGDTKQTEINLYTR